MFYMFDPIFIEFLIPGHNLIILLKMVLLSKVNLFQVVAVISVNAGLGIVLMKRCANMLEGGEYDRSNKRFKKIFFR